ncbi:L-type lectin-domain containing receptor kinase S.4-like [Euphorbia lathyris]|uniref:L-type lectin-domain containing receptor kinase S.4-like n=1 Tax=Euphorbia lathyris TaxID=212925 RepID=UPI0033141A78
MAAFFISTSLFALCFILFYPQLLLSDPISSFSFQRFDKVSNFALYGDASAVSNGSALQLTNSVNSSSGRVMYKNPIKLARGNNENPVKLASFSTYLSFSMTPENGDGLAFVMVSGGFNVSAFDTNNPFGLSLRSEKSGSEIVAVEFDTKRDFKYDDLDGNHVGINVGGFESVNASSANVILNNGSRLNAWIDYEASSMRLEVRLSQFGDLKPMDPLLSYQIDLSKLWKDENVYLGLSSSNGNSSNSSHSSQTCLIYSWSFLLRGFPHWMHSEPLDPETFGKNAKPVVVIHKRSTCVLRVLAAMIFGTACGALGAFMVLYLWTIFGDRRPVVPEVCSSVHPVDFEYKKVKVVVEKAVEDGKQ